MSRRLAAVNLKNRPRPRLPGNLALEPKVEYLSRLAPKIARQASLACLAVGSSWKDSEIAKFWERTAAELDEGSVAALSTLRGLCVIFCANLRPPDKTQVRTEGRKEHQDSIAVGHQRAKT